MEFGPIIRTERLVLHRWRAEDLQPFAAMNADPAVVEFLPSALTRDESDAMVRRVEAHFDAHGFGFWAVSTAEQEFVGLVGLAVVSFEAPFTPAVEVGWRLAKSQWGKGYATEAGRAAVDYGFEQLGLEEIVSFTVPANVRSRAVMERLGMTHHAGDDFDHPRLPVGHPLRRHVLYRTRQRDSRRF